MRALLLSACVVAVAGAAFAQSLSVSTAALSASQELAQQIMTEAYWTVEKMQSAIPMERSMLVSDVPQGGAAASEQPQPSGIPGFGPGATPAMAQAGARLAPAVYMPQFARSADFTPASFGVPPTNPLSGFTGPFQRFGQAGRYLQYPVSTVGKLFFTIGASNFVCSGTAINRSTYVTAGHCVSSGASSFYSNFLFCPSWVPGATTPLGNAGSGCWSWASVTTTTAWHTTGNPNYDYACVVTATTGSRFPTKMGNVTGWAGRGWNWFDMLEVSMGYPHAAPFNGFYMHANAAPEWYTTTFGFGGPASKLQGNDLTGGSSGGPWILGYANGSAGAEGPDVDGRSSTDPGFFAVNGNNSHKRCTGGTCKSPPDNVSGVFWNEMSSPRYTDAAGNGSEAIFGLCFAHGNNNP